MTDQRAAAVIGGGNMGADIAAILAAHGWRVTVVEPGRDRWPALRERIAHSAKQLGNPAVDFGVVAASPDVPWGGIGLVIECAPENLDLKRAIFAELERLAPAEAILASNSSSFPISEIAAGLATRSRMLGLHFFLPAHLVPAVEVIRGEATDDAVWKRAAEIMRGCGKVPVMVKKDIPGFLANRIQHALMREAFALIDAGLATPEDIDNAVRYGFGFRYVAAGPILQKDFAGLDIHLAAGTTMYPDLADNKAPSPTLAKLVAEGKLGVKTGEGFWKWTPESAAAARERYERDLADALTILKRSLGSRR
jgi:3-hydroxybutyryl-CoA dehydrogenase